MVYDRFHVMQQLLTALDLVRKAEHRQLTHSSTGTKHFALDHLGSPRVVTGPLSTNVAYENFAPFGEGGATGAGSLQFTGHERDWSPAGGSDPLDYMHARWYVATAGRFLSLDPLLGQAAKPQSWNRYVYLVNNPLGQIDPDGRGGLDLFNGAVNAFGSDLALGRGRVAGNEDFTLGQKLGDFAATTTGMVETFAGFAGEIGGVALDATGAGAVGGVPVNVVSAGFIAHGTAAGSIGLIHLAGNANGGRGSQQTQTTSTTLYNKGGRRIDVENPNPAKRPGQVHLQIGKDKYVFDAESKLFKGAPKSVQRLLSDPEI
jgi:RHS repeat-associated protein